MPSIDALVTQEIERRREEDARRQRDRKAQEVADRRAAIWEFRKRLAFRFTDEMLATLNPTLDAVIFDHERIERPCAHFLVDNFPYYLIATPETAREDDPHGLMLRRGSVSGPEAWQKPRVVPHLPENVPRPLSQGEYEWRWIIQQLANDREDVMRMENTHPE